MTIVWGLKELITAKRMVPQLGLEKSWLHAKWREVVSMSSGEEEWWKQEPEALEQTKENQTAKEDQKFGVKKDMP